MTSTRKNLVLSSAFLVLGLAITWETFDYGAKSAVFLRGLAVALSLMALSYLAINLLRRQHHNSAQPDTSPRPSWLDNHGNALLIFGMVGGYVALMQIVGFLLSTMLFGYLTQLAIARRHRLLHVVYAVLMSAAIYLIFFKLLGIAAPESLLSLDQTLKFL
ncbi:MULTISPECIES: tripartite tricarboxylate transporter TctB family protein [unclassified Halomonas]|uniref:tripartite tricarboxylate transporter TctB family protein n=1 Tax=unclassified Halomonas TaxID=2609666 RepID=UPI002888D751|nr:MULTISPECIES: tripartite tricarboxylate transporter TctB family protein [unclassified Halomonas]MDT0501091.1 tripartite tricarboxylate transporter TctB family protein [Halomonas sp. PAR7]MDT0513282.1 tripartite tricarboxylate transporter TctB family protein [Halomonas sp. LES1]MDT0592205.1 tripartite tricarboxylate transporter TctB family protein [Halomonas sp. PAR8]